MVLLAAIAACWLELVVIVLLPLSTLRLQAAPFSGRTPYRQPDGTLVELWGQGDDFQAVFETLDGFTVVFDDARHAYCYAKPSPDPDVFASTGVQVQEKRGEDLGLPRHLRLRPEGVRREAEGLRAKWTQQMDLRPLGRGRKLAQSGPRGTQGLPHSSTIGTKTALCLLIDFDDDPATIPQVEIDQFCNGSNYSGFGNWGSVRQYFAYNSNGRLDYRNVVTAYVRIPNSLHSKGWYNDPTKGAGEQGNYLLRDAIDLLKHLPNFESEIAPTLTGLTLNAAGEVLACNVFYAGGNSGVWNRGLWPHSYALAIVGPQELWGGGPKVNRYQITNIESDLSLGTFCHESGHLLCHFPDIYDYGYDSVGGAGVFCIMNSGGYAKTPVQFCAYLKAAADWATLTDLMTASASTLTLDALPGANFNHFYYYQNPRTDREYFLLECRYKGGPDSALPGSGIAIWHVDEDGDRDNQSLDFNSLHANYELTLVQADNQWDFEKNLNSGEAADLYYNGNPGAGYGNVFADASLPTARWWSGDSSGLALTNFSAPGPEMTFSTSVIGIPTNETPIIVYEPASQCAVPGSNIQLKVTAIGAQPLTYQWYQGTQALAGATDRVFQIPSAGMDALGEYTVVAQNQFGSATSHVADVFGIAAPGQVNLANYAYEVALSGTLALVTGSDGALSILDVADPNDLRIISRYAAATTTVGVDVAGAYAYVGARDQGLLVLDLADTYNPRTVAKCSTGGDTRDVKVAGTYAYVADIFGGLVVVDLSDPLQPRKVGQCRATASKGERLALFDHYAAMACQEGGLQLIDVSNPAQPVLVGGYVTEPVPGKDQNAVGITVLDGIAYLAENQGGMKIVDVHDPTSPSLLGYGPTSFAKCVAVSGNRAFVADYLEGLVVFDVSEPRNPRRLGVMSTPGSGETVLVRDGFLHMADGTGGFVLRKLIFGAEQGLAEFVTHPTGQVASAGTAVTLSASAFVAGGFSYQWCRDGQPVSGATEAVLTFPSTQGTDAGAYQLRIRNAAGDAFSKPAFLSVLSSPARLALPGPGSGVAIQQGYAYVAAGQAGLVVVDLSDPTSPKVTGSLATAREAAKVAVQGDYACVADNNAGLIIVDVSDPANPRQISSVSTPMSAAVDVAIQGNFVYVADTWGGFYVVNIQDPAAPQRLATGPTLNFTYAIAVSGGIAFVGDGGAGLQIYDVSNLDNIRHLAGVDTTGWSVGTALYDGYVYLVDRWSCLSVFDVISPGLPRWLRQIGTSGWAQRVATMRGLAFVADNNGSLDVFSLERPDTPTLAKTLAIGSNAQDVAVADHLVCVADAQSGLVVFRVDTPTAAPAIVQPPAGKHCSPGENVSLAVVASGVEPLRYQWHHNGTALPDSNTPDLTVTNFDAGKQGAYFVEVMNAYGTTRSLAVNVALGVPPVILVQPSWGSLVTGLDCSLNVVAAGEESLTYQWYKDGNPLAGATRAELSIAPATVAATGSYTVRVANAYGSIDSVPLPLTVDYDQMDRLVAVGFGTYTYAVAAVPGYAFVAAGSAGLQCLDISVPANPRVVGTLSTPGSSKGIFLAGRYAFVATGSGGSGPAGLRIVDVSFPTEPTLVGNLDTGGDSADVVVRDGLAYVADGPRGLQIVDVTHPQAPAALGVCDTPGYAVRVTLAGNYAYVADRSSGLQVVDVSDPSFPSIVASRPTPDMAVGVTVDGNLLRVADEGAGLLTFDITDPSAPMLLASFKSGFAKCSAAAGPYTIVGDYSGGLFLLDTSDPKLPSVVRSWHGGNGEAVAVVGGLICVADGALGFTVFTTAKLTGAGNHAPVLSPLVDLTVSAGVPLAFTVTATDADLPAQALTFRLGPGAPRGAGISRDGVFSWTPWPIDAGRAHPVTIEVSDGWTTTSQTFQVTVHSDTAPPDPIVSDGLVAWYPFEQSPADYGPHGYDGMINGAEPAPDRFGRPDAAYAISPGKSIELPSFPWPSHTNVSVTLWLKAEYDPSGFKNFLTKAGGNGLDGGVQMLLRTMNGAYMTQFDTAGSARYLFSGKPPSTNQFDFVVFTYDGSTERLYLNTNLVASTAAPGGIATNDVPITLGGGATDSSAGRAVIDDFRVYDHVLTAAERQYLYLDSRPELNHPPVLEPMPSQVVDVGQTLSFKAVATDDDVPVQPLTFSLDPGAPYGASITTDGQFTWTPYEFQAGSTNQVTINVRDYWSTTSQTVQIAVTGTNIPPGSVFLPGTIAWYPFQGNAIDYGSYGYHGTFHGVSTVADRFGRTNSAAWFDGSGYAEMPSFAWPSQTNISIALWVKPTLPNIGSYQDILSKHSGSGDVQALIRTGLDGKYYCQWNVGGALYTTGLAAPSGNQFDFLVLSYDGRRIRFYVNASLVSTLTAFGNVVSNSLPVTLGAKATGHTSEHYAGALDDLRFFDHALSTAELVALYRELPNPNHAPVLSPLADQTLSEGRLVTFTASATDSDVPAQMLAFTLDPSAPDGASITSDGLFTWTPTEAQGPGSYPVTIRVSDGVTNTSETIQIGVNEVNAAPVLPVVMAQTVNESTMLTVTNTAADTDLPANALTYRLVTAPEGAQIDGNGVITWTPGEEQGPSTNVITTIVDDDGLPPLSSTNSFTVVVNEVNMAPVLTVPAAQTVNELATLSVSASATDSDIPVNPLVFALVSAPTGMSIDRNSGLITWTPSQAQSPATNFVQVRVTDTNPAALNSKSLSVTNGFTVIVREVNQLPVMPVIARQTVNELTLLTITNTAGEANIHATLTYALVNPPAGAGIDSQGMITWTPSQAQSPSTNTITTIATSTDGLDLANPALTATNRFEVVVREVNQAPALPTIALQTVNELTLLTVTNTAGEANIHAVVGYALLEPPEGTSIDSNGVITWIPSEAQGPGTNIITTVATSTNLLDLVNSTLSATNSFTVVVNEVNTPPALGPLSNYSINPGQVISFTATATDSDIPANTLIFSLISPPTGASIDPGSGLFTWRPVLAQAGTTNTVRVQVTDYNPWAGPSQRLSDLRSFVAVINPMTPVVLTPEFVSTNQLRIQVDGLMGPDYTLQSSSTLTNWSDLITTNPAVMPFGFIDLSPGSSSNRFYRVRLRP